MSRVASIVVGNLKCADPWADNVQVAIYSDAGLTNLVGIKSSRLTYDPSVNLKTQTDPIIFDGLTLGTTYWLRCVTVFSQTGATSTPQIFSCLAGNSTPPNVTYSYAATQTPTGYYFQVTPISAPSDVDHYDWWYTSSATDAPTTSTFPKGAEAVNASGQYNFFAGSGSGPLYLWLRAVNTSGVYQPWVNVSQQIVPNQLTIQVKSVGQYAVTAYGNSGCWINDNPVLYGDGSACQRGFNIVVIDRSTYTVRSFTNFNPTGNANDAGNMATFLSSQTNTNNAVIVIFSHLDSSTNRLGQGLPAAMYYLGASRQVFSSVNYKVCSSYILVAQNYPLAGQGNGIELYTGNADLSNLSYAETTFHLINGKVLGYNGTYPSSAMMDAAQGDLAGNGSVPPSIGQSFSYSASTTSIQWNWNLNVYKPDIAATVIGINSALDTTGLSAGTRYYFYPYYDDNVASGTYGTVQWVNNGEVSGGAVGNTGCAYPNINYTCVQFAQRMDHLPLTAGALEASTTSSGTGGGSGGGSGSCLWEYTTVKEKYKGYINLFEVDEGDWLDSPDGWAQVSEITFAPQDLWVGMKFVGCEQDEEFLTTPGHEWETTDGILKQSAKLSIEDLIPTKNGVTAPESIRIVRRPLVKARVTVKTERNLFYIGYSNIQTHNIILLAC